MGVPSLRELYDETGGKLGGFVRPCGCEETIIGDTRYFKMCDEHGTNYDNIFKDKATLDATIARVIADRKLKAIH